MKYLTVGLLTLMFSQAYCQSFTTACDNQLVFDKTDTPPELLISIAEINQLLNEQVQMTKKQAKKTGKLGLQVIINCKGESGDYKVMEFRGQDGKPVENEFDVFAPQIITLIKDSTRWNPASQKGNKVDHRVIFKISVNKGDFNLRLM